MNGCLGPKLHTQNAFIYLFTIGKFFIVIRFHLIRALCTRTHHVHNHSSYYTDKKGYAYALCTLATPLIIKSSHLSPFYFCVTKSRLIFETFCWVFFASFSVLPFCWLSLFSANIARLHYSFSILNFNLSLSLSKSPAECNKVRFVGNDTKQISSSANS